MNKDIENLQNWLDGKYVSPPDFKESLQTVINQFNKITSKNKFSNLTKQDWKESNEAVERK